MYSFSKEDLLKHNGILWGRPEENHNVSQYNKRASHLRDCNSLYFQVIKEGLMGRYKVCSSPITIPMWGAFLFLLPFTANQWNWELKLKIGYTQTRLNNFYDCH